MASAEHTASLPPIIEDEVDENLLPMFYQKELERKDYQPHGAEKSSTQSNESCSVQSNGSPLPYNSWKAKNKMLSRGVENGICLDMVSRLGQSLENCRSVVPGRMQDGFQNASNPNTIYNPDGIPFKTHSMMGHQTEQAFINQRNVEYKKYFHAQQDVPPNPQMFDPNFMQNTTPRIYPGAVGGYQRCTLNDGKNQFNPDGNSPFHVQSAVNNGYEHTDSSPTHFKHNSSSKSQFNPLVHSSQFRSGIHPENHRFEKICQKSCCQGNFIAQNTYMNGFVPSDRRDLNHGNPIYNDNTPSPHQNSVSRKTSNCHCNHSSEVKLNKKSEKNKNKQISDLYRIVWLQNQQLIQLQNEVKKLVEYNVKNEERNQKIFEQEHGTKKQSKSTLEKRMFNLHVIEENKNLMEKVSVGIMTSFIDTTSVKKRGKNKDAKKKKEVVSNKFENSSESETSSYAETSCEEKEKRQKEIQKKIGNKKYKSGKIEDSIALNGIDIPSFAEDIPSPTASVHIDMQDYGSSSASDSSDVSDSGEETPVPVSWTFYDKVVGKVNNMLNTSESESEGSDDQVRNKTLEQLRKLGVSVEESPISKRVTFDEAAYIPQQQKLFLGESDTSIKMNALALKYLQEDKTSAEESSPKGFDKSMNGPANNTNLSLATLRYLEKYHLLPRVGTNSPEVKAEKPKKKKEKRKEEKTARKKKSKTNQHSGKILDITAIKQQPKLLPKTQ